MTFPISLIRIRRKPICRLSGRTPPAPDEVNARVQAIWDQETQRRSTKLFNGEIVSVMSVDETNIVGRRAEYRWLLAQSHDESFVPWFQVRPLAVTGVLTCPEGVVIGRRGPAVFQFPGLWELAPSGSVDIVTDVDSDIDLLAQLIQELNEEVGLSGSDVAGIEPLAIACDFDSQVFDVCFVMTTPTPWARIAERFSANRNTEYQHLDILPVDRIAEFLRTNQASTTPLTLSLLQLLENEHKLGTLPPPRAPVPAPRKPKTAIIVQARMGSTRLPGKILRQLAGRTVLDHVIDRLRRVRNADAVVVATSNLPADDVIAEAARNLGVDVYRGDESDVLMRYLGAARMVDAEIIMRVTSDCPLIDPALCEAVLALRAEADAGYASNNMPRLFPHGLDCEAFTREALEQAAADATEGYDREHVTPWIRRSAEIRHANLVGPGWPANQHRWTLDYPEDFTFFSELFGLLPADRLLSWQEVLSLIGTHPRLAMTNSRHRVTPALAPSQTGGVAVFHFEANAGIGIGHAMRCNALQSLLENLGWRCHWAIDARTEAFLASSVPPASIVRLSDGCSAIQAEEIAAAVGRCDALIIDRYGPTVEFARAARKATARVIYFDDLADRAMDADIVINANPGFTEAQYRTLNDRPGKLLLGPQYALLRQQFVAHRARTHERLAAGHLHPLRRIVVAFGGVDPLNGTAVALQALAAFPEIAVDVVLGGSAAHLPDVRARLQAYPGNARLITDAADMAGILVGADLVIGAPGTSTWERACLGLPSILVGIAENQRPNADYVVRSGAGLLAGFLTDTPPEAVGRKLAEQLGELLQAPQRLLDLARSAAALCDGRGGKRIVAAMLETPELGNGKISLRVVEAGDEALLLDWQREPETRRFALNPAIPSSEEHHLWLQERLLASTDWFLIAEIDGDPRGFVRLDWIGEDAGRPEYVISIATTRRHHRQGIGTGLLQAIRRLSPGAHFFAKILPDNAPSLALFVRAGYRLAADGFFHSRPQ
jgi:UDP-2,4-diacetamido-2,4,6-trideoxy-beta-L-altropyranose hydrolase